jgi:hypothetical protein
MQADFVLSFLKENAETFMLCEKIIKWDFTACKTCKHGGCMHYTVTKHITKPKFQNRCMLNSKKIF